MLLLFVVDGAFCSRVGYSQACLPRLEMSGALLFMRRTSVMASLLVLLLRSRLSLVLRLVNYTVRFLNRLGTFVSKPVSSVWLGCRCNILLNFSLNMLCADLPNLLKHVSLLVVDQRRRFCRHQVLNIALMYLKRR